MVKIVIIIFVLYNCFIGTIAFDCNGSDGTYANSNDYQSYYVCKNNCPRLEFCPNNIPYFSSSTQNCSSTPKDWIPFYYLNGHEISIDGPNSVLYVRQDGYKVLWTVDSAIRSSTFTGRYINQTHIRGIDVQKFRDTNCIHVFNVEIVVSADRTFCSSHHLDAYSSKCDSPHRYDLSGCRTLSY